MWPVQFIIKVNIQVPVGIHNLNVHSLELSALE